MEKIVEHGLVGGLRSEAEGGDFGSGFLSGAAAEAADPYVQEGLDAVGLAGDPTAEVVASAVVGGTAAVIGGGKFANGAVTGAFGAVFGLR